MVVDIVTIIALIVGPTFGVLIGLCYQNRQVAKDRQHLIFYILMAGRKASPPSDIWKYVVNLLEAVFSDKQELHHLYHQWVEALMEKEGDPAKQERIFVQMMDAFAQYLGYKKIQQVDISKVPF